MKDYLLELSKNRTAKRLISSLGLPIPIPEPLDRTTSPWEARPLDGTTVAFDRAGNGLGSAVEDALRDSGADVTRGVPTARVKCLVFDATSVESPNHLSPLFDFFHAGVVQLDRGGRILVVGRSTTDLSIPASAAQAALDGFVRSAAKEIGRRGATAQLIRVEPEAARRLSGVIRFLLSRRAAFISGQTIDVTTRVAGAPPPTWTRVFDGKVALVTGGARGIGAATARLLAGEGAHVVVLDRPDDEAAADELASSIGGTAFALDVSASDAPSKLVQFLRGRFGGVDVVVHNAGITRDKTLARMSAEQWSQAIEVNLAAVVRLTEALLDGTLRDGGRLICLSSIAGIAGNVGQTNYAASKAGIIGLVRAVAAQVASRGITANAIAPGFIETRMTAAVPFAIREAGRRMSSLAQGGQPEDVGQAIMFLASPGALGVTGSVLRVCGQSFLGA